MFEVENLHSGWSFLMLKHRSCVFRIDSGHELLSRSAFQNVGSRDTNQPCNKPLICKNSNRPITIHSNRSFVVKSQLGKWGKVRTYTNAGTTVPDRQATLEGNKWRLDSSKRCETTSGCMPFPDIHEWIIRTALNLLNKVDASYRAAELGKRAPAEFREFAVENCAS